MSAGVVRVATQVDHRIALTNGGKDFDVDPAQAQALCAPCHVDKTNEDMGRKVKHPVAIDGVPQDPSHPWNI
jgi:5-methylcytosine-specific restriction endonuclease McrA